MIPIEAALALIALSVVSFAFGCAVEHCVEELLKDHLEAKIERIQSVADEESVQDEIEVVPE